MYTPIIYHHQQQPSTLLDAVIDVAYYIARYIILYGARDMKPYYYIYKSLIDKMHLFFCYLLYIVMRDKNDSTVKLYTP